MSSERSWKSSTFLREYAHAAFVHVNVYSISVPKFFDIGDWTVADGVSDRVVSINGAPS